VRWWGPVQCFNAENRYLISSHSTSVWPVGACSIICLACGEPVQLSAWLVGSLFVICLACGEPVQWFAAVEAAVEPVASIICSLINMDVMFDSWSLFNVWLVKPVQLSAWLVKPVQLSAWLVKPVQLSAWLVKPVQSSAAVESVMFDSWSLFKGLASGACSIICCHLLREWETSLREGHLLVSRECRRRWNLFDRPGGFGRDTGEVFSLDRKVQIYYG